MTSDKDNKDAYMPTTPVGGRLTPPTAKGDPALAGKRIGVYEIVEQIGRGGMGAVYRAKDRSLDRDVALKILLPELAADPEFEKRFVREARAAAQLDHPNIVAVYTAGRFENLLFIAMQYIQGKTLHEVILEKGKFAVGEALDIILQAAEALSAAHKIELIHRDIKPNNIMITPDGRVKLMDFGLMRSIRKPDGITQAGVFYGTPEYASPEQCETGVLDGRSDLYSLGAVLYEMLTGRMPHVAETPLALFKKITSEDPLPILSLTPGVPPAVDALVRRMLARRREDRFRSAEEVAAEIRKIQSGKAESVGSPSNRVRIAAVAAAVLIAAGIGIAIHFNGHKRGSRSSGASDPASGTGGTTPNGGTPTTERLNLAVFDFRNDKKTPESEWLEIAIPDMLITSLSQLPKFQVPTRDQLLWKLRDHSMAGQISEENRRVLIDEFQSQIYLTGWFIAQNGEVQVTVYGYRLPGNEKAFEPKFLRGKEEKIFELIDQLAEAVTRGIGTAPASEPAAGGKAMPSSRELAMNFGRRSELKRSHDAVEEKAPMENLHKLEAEKEESKKFEEKEQKQNQADKAAPAKDDDSAHKDRGDAKKKEGGVDKALAKTDEKAKEDAAKEKNSYAGAPSGRNKGGEKGAVLKAMSREELVKSWYINRRAVEKSGLERDEIETLLDTLRSQYGLEGFEIEGFQVSIENFNNCFQEYRKQRKEGGGKIDPAAIVYECPGCHGQGHGPGKCGPCGVFLVLKFKLPPKKAGAPAKEDNK